MTAREEILEYARKQGWTEHALSRPPINACLQHPDHPGDRVWVDFIHGGRRVIEASAYTPQYPGVALRIYGGVPAIKKHLKERVT